MRRRDYGPRARIGVAVPFANPTVEPELQALMPDGVAVYATRLHHPSPQVADRLEHYIRHIPEAVETFGTLTLGAFGFGCTGSSYLAGVALEDELVARAQERAGLPIVTAAQAVRRALRHLGVGRVALVSPYPEWLAEAGYRYWRDAGFVVSTAVRVEPRLADTHEIYELTSQDALLAVERLDNAGADAVVIAGTGMPTLAALGALASAQLRPVVSSNLCLAWALLHAAAVEGAGDTPGECLQVVEGLR